MSTRICFIRHGETDWNAEKRIQGQLDIPLNEIGRAQALAMASYAAHFDFATVYSSDLNRAKQTAEALIEGRGRRARQLGGFFCGFARFGAVPEGDCPEELIRTG